MGAVLHLGQMIKRIYMFDINGVYFVNDIDGRRYVVDDHLLGIDMLARHTLTLERNLTIRKTELGSVL